MGLTYAIVQKRKLFPLRGRLSLIPNFLSRLLLVLTDASPHEVVSVRVTQLGAFPSLLLTDPPATKFSIHTGAGVVDVDYRGLLFILFFNLGDKDFEGPFACLYPRLLRFAYFFLSVNEGDRIAQLTIERIYTPEISVVEDSGQKITRLASCPRDSTVSGRL